MKQYYVYILRCADDSLYTGITSDLDRRLKEHQTGVLKSAYTYKRRPVRLEYFEKFTTPELAIAFEKRLKNWSKQKKEALIAGEFDRLQILSECRNATHSKYKP